MAITNATRVADFGSGIGTQGAVLQVDNTNNRIGIGTTNPNQMLQVGTAVSVYGNSGIVSATSFYGDGANLTNVGMDTGVVVSDQIFVVGVTTFGAGVAGTIRANGDVTFAGVVTATSFSGDGSTLTGVSGFATALSSDTTSFLNKVFQTPKTEPVGAGTSIQITGSDQCGNIVFTRVGQIDVGTGATVTVSTGTTFIMNVLNVF